jgi:hypothetical protein
MEPFRRLSQHMKFGIIVSALFLFTLSLGILVFGADGLSQGHELIEQAKGSVQADMLYSHPTGASH